MDNMSSVPLLNFAEDGAPDRDYTCCASYCECKLYSRVKGDHMSKKYVFIFEAIAEYMFTGWRKFIWRLLCR